jgi:hypothetical protein
LDQNNHKLIDVRKELEEQTQQLKLLASESLPPQIQEHLTNGNLVLPRKEIFFEEKFGGL